MTICKNVYKRKKHLLTYPFFSFKYIYEQANNKGKMINILFDEFVWIQSCKKISTKHKKYNKITLIKKN